jgi:hypothetical protein
MSEANCPRAKHAYATVNNSIVFMPIRAVHPVRVFCFVLVCLVP